MTHSPPQAKFRSKQNTFMAVPVVFIMISNHFPGVTYGERYNWAVLAILILAGWIAAKFRSQQMRSFQQARQLVGCHQCNISRVPPVDDDYLAILSHAIAKRGKIGSCSSVGGSVRHMKSSNRYVQRYCTGYEFDRQGRLEPASRSQPPIRHYFAIGKIGSISTGTSPRRSSAFFIGARITAYLSRIAFAFS